MRRVMALVLGAGAGHKVVKRLHLGGHVLHLGVDDADGFFMDGLGGRLDSCVPFVCCLKGEDD